MPNHIKNRIIVIDGPNPEAVIEFITGEESGEKIIDFNKITPMPKILLGGTSSSVTHLAKVTLGIIRINDLISSLRTSPEGSERAEMFKAGDYGNLSNILEKENILRMLFKGDLAADMTDDNFERFIKVMRAYRKTKHLDWYEWSIENWGTKWNAYDCKFKNPTTVLFDTAWSAPLPIILKLSFRFPENKIRFSWADEDTGSNTGDCVLKNGEIIQGDKIENQSSEAYEMAFELRPHYKEDYIKNADGTYSYAQE